MNKDYGIKSIVLICFIKQIKYTTPNKSCISYIYITLILKNSFLGYQVKETDLYYKVHVL